MAGHPVVKESIMTEIRLSDAAACYLYWVAMFLLFVYLLPKLRFAIRRVRRVQWGQLQVDLGLPEPEKPPDPGIPEEEA
jgi:hypothetical protein